jgi:hypothetical protein
METIVVGALFLSAIALSVRGKQWKDQIRGGLADKRKPSDFNQRSLKKGIKTEMEHTKNRKIATEIAMDHLIEHLNYYNVLPQAEKTMIKRRRQKRSR